MQDTSVQLMRCLVVTDTNSDGRKAHF
jgi:hypothetical protein